jgi:trk system potassium uptake protein TrkA
VSLHIVIMGCGRVGSLLATRLLDSGHTVAIIDRDADAFRRLGPDFAGQQVVGVGFDPDILRSAGIEKAAAFAAVSSGDNSNIIAARVARETFAVANVVARIYDPGRVEVYQRLGIPTVGTVRWTADRMLRRLLPAGSEPEWRDQSGAVVLAEVHVDPSWVGRRIVELEQAAGVRLAFVTRDGDGMIPTASMVLQEGDLVHVVTAATDLERVEQVLGAGPGAS